MPRKKKSQGQDQGDALLPVPEKKHSKEKPPVKVNVDMIEKPRYNNSPTQQLFPIDENTGKNAEVSNLIAFKRSFWGLERVDFKETSGVRDRIEYYFSKCEEFGYRPTVVGLASVLGITRMILYELVSGNYRRNNPPYGATKEVSDLLQKAYQDIQDFLEMGIMTGKVNPVAGMFLLKNHAGYTDKNEIVVSTSHDEESVIDLDEIRQRYEKS